MEHFKVAKWGNSLAVRLPSKMVKSMGISVGDLLPHEVITGGALIRARLAAEREDNRINREEALESIRRLRSKFPKNLKPEDWKVDHDDPDMRG